VTLPSWFETATLVVLGLILVVDLAIVTRRPRIPSLRECTFWVVGYVTMALAFAVLLSVVSGADVAGEFVSGWITEYSLSVDNLFVFVLIMSRFGVPRGNQQMVLMMGIILSLVLRGGCIVVGAAAIERFSWVFYLFGAFLVYTAIQFIRESDEHEEFTENALLRHVRRLLPIAPDYNGSKLIIVHAGRRMFTPMMIVFLAIGSTDLLFAVDSIPAIFGLTQDPFIVFTATIFALMGLRQLYFLLGGLLDRLVYLSVGLSVILGFIGVKMIFEALHTNDLGFINSGDPVAWAPDIPTFVSLGVIVVVLAATTVVSLLSSPGQPDRPASGESPPPPPAGERTAGSPPRTQAVPGQARPGQVLSSSRRATPSVARGARPRAGSPHQTPAKPGQIPD
jgi:tellurite resistance protein TerC